MTAVYNEETVPGEIEPKMALTSMNLEDVDNHMKYRLGTSLVMDYTTTTTKVKFSNFFSKRASEYTTRSASIDGGGISHNIDFGEDNITVLNNALTLEHYIGDYKLNGSIAYAYSRNESPLGVSAGFWDNTGIMEELAYFYMPPIEVPKLPIFGFHLEESSIGSIGSSNYKTKNTQLSLNFDIEKQFEITNWMGLNIKLGGKYKHQSKAYDYTYGFIWFHYDQDWFGLLQALADADIPWLPNTVAGLQPESSHNPSPFFAGSLVTDPDYKEEDLLLGDYDLKEMPDKDRILYLLNYAKSIDYFFQVNSSSYGGDYHGTEDYTGAYIMPQVDLFGKLTLNTGIRYERNETDYTAWRLPEIRYETPSTPQPEQANYDVNRKRKNEFFLPMLHAIYRPNDWLSVRTSYTHTLSRPKFRDFIPRWRIYRYTIDYNDPYLKPALAKNIDFYLSFHEAKLGLFTIGGYNKTIEDL
ncbi:MAG: TonB-dependent receptor, partial [bacterium]